MPFHHLRPLCKALGRHRPVTERNDAELVHALDRSAREKRELVGFQIGVATIRLILRNLSALTQYLAELRGLYGSGHGRDGKHRGLEPRHARLAVGAAVAFIDFVTETYHQRHVAEALDQE